MALQGNLARRLVVLIMIQESHILIQESRIHQV